MHSLKTRITPYLFVMPAFIMVGIFTWGGSGFGFWASLREYTGLFGESKYIGFENYVTLVFDQKFWQALIHVSIFGLITVFSQMAIGLFLAILLSNPNLHFKVLYRSLIFIPVIISPAVISVAFRQILSPEGEINAILNWLQLGFMQQEWLADPKWALLALSGINIWQWTGLSCLLYLASLTQLPEEIVEAAQLDGATSRQIILKVIVPLMKGTHLTLMIMGFIGAMKTFDLVFLTTGGGPAGSTETLTTYIFDQAVARFHLGYSSTISMVLITLSMIAAWFLIKQNRETS